MSFIKETSKVNCRPIETLIAESELTLEVQDFNDFIMTKDITTSESVQLMTNSEATWSLKLQPVEPHSPSSYLRFKVVIDGLPKMVLENFKVAWSLHVHEKLVLERTMKHLEDGYCLHVTYFTKHVNSAGSAYLVIKLTVKSVGHKKLTTRALNTSVAAYTTLKSLLSDASMCDFKFIVGKKEFQVHRAILAASSPMMKKMFTVDMAESNKGMCEVSEIESDTFAALLAFVYCGDLPENFSEMAVKLYEAARYYQIDRLEKACALELRNNLSVANALEIYRWVYLFDELQELKTAAWDFIKSDILKIYDPLKPMDPEKIAEVLGIRQMESDFWKKNKDN